MTSSPVAASDNPAGRPPIPPDEPARLAALQAFKLLDTEAEPAYDDLTMLASIICDTPIALITLVDDRRQWFKSRVGLDATETPRDVAFCAHAINRPHELLEVPDTHQDRRFVHNPLVTGELGVRFYAGAPLVTDEGHALGTLCVLDDQPRQLDERQRAALAALARQVVAQFRLRDAVARLAHASLTDGLTSAWNRRAFDQRLQEEWQRHERGEKPLGLMMLDVDHFKRFNDQHGHAAGDETLVEVVRLARSTLRSIDFLARYGGEEFAIILPHADLAGLQQAAERIRSTIEAAAWPRSPVTVSIGVAATAPPAQACASPDALIDRADRALYAAKRAGRNRVEVAPPPVRGPQGQGVPPT